MINGKRLESGKMGRKLLISIIISIAIFSFTTLSIFKINYGKEEQNYKAQKGIMDLENWETDKEKIIDLDGEWEFYSGVLLEPGEKLDNMVEEYVKVPGSWESYLNEEGSTSGSGTYRLIIRVPEDRLYGIKARTIRVANRIYLNGEEVAHAGNPSLDRNQAKAGSQYNLGIGNSLNGEIELIVQVTSQEFRSGGIIKSIELSTADGIMLADDKSLLLDALVVSVCLVLSLYFLAMYLQRNRDPYLAYFSGANFFMGINL